MTLKLSGQSIFSVGKGENFECLKNFFFLINILLLKYTALRSYGIPSDWINREIIELFCTII